MKRKTKILKVVFKMFFHEAMSTRINATGNVHSRVHSHKNFDIVKQDIEITSWLTSAYDFYSRVVKDY